MANYSAIKAAVNAYIKANGKKEITGRILNSVLNATIDSLGKGFQFGGVLTPADDPGQPDQNVAYIGAAGTYSNFDNLVIESGNIGIFLWNGDWSFETIPVGKDYDNDIQSLTNGLQELSDNVIHLDGINEEDLSIPEGGKLQFANRVYNAQQPNGMGYVILRKNKTFAEQVTEANTIYEIRYEFVMTGDFTMPSGCVLRFNGGSISGAYDFTGNKTGIIAPIRQVFGTNIRIAGTWEVEMAFPEWFGAAGNGVTDDTYAIQNCFLFKSPTLMTRVYLISQSVRFYNSINGNGASLKYGADCFMYSQGISDFYVRDLKIDGQSLSRSGIRFDNVQNVVIDNCTIENIGNQNIAQVSALYFATSTNCKNAYIQGCKIKNVGYDGNGACSGIGFSNHAGDTETANNGLYVYDCRFEGFNTSSEDSDCIKILSDNGLNTNVVISGCFFTGIGKRAVKTQAIGVKLIGNTYEVVTPIYAVVSFQRGGGESLNDTLIVNPADGETSEYLVANVFECAYGDVSISGFNTIVKNSVNVDGSHMMFCYIGGLGSTTFDGLRITNCVVGHCGFLFRFVAETTFTNILVDNVMFKNPASFQNRLFGSTPAGITNSKFENIGRLRRYNPLNGLDFSKIFNCSFILDSDSVGFGGTNNIIDNGNLVVINYDPTLSNVERVEYNGGRMRNVYASVETNPSGLGSSKWAVLRDGAANVGTIVFKKTPTISSDSTKMEMGYILTSQSGSSVGTAVVYSIPLQ